MYDVLPDSDAILAQFNRLMQELISGAFRRNSFRPWEIELLLDLDSCELGEPSKRELLRRYQKTVQRQMAKGRADSDEDIRISGNRPGKGVRSARRKD